MEKMYKEVDGIKVEMTEAEIAERKAFEKAWVEADNAERLEKAKKIKQEGVL